MIDDIVEIINTFFFFNDTATTEIYTLSLHDALPISAFLGYFYTGAFIFEALGRWFFAAAEKKDDYLNTAKQLIFCLLLLVVVSLINPLHYEIITYPFDKMQQSFQISQITEWQPLSLPMITVHLVIMTVLFLLALPGLFKEKHWGITLITLFFAIMTIKHLRFQVDFLLVAIWPAHHFLKDLKTRSYVFELTRKLVTIALFVLVLSNFLIFHRNLVSTGLGIQKREYPIQAAKFIEQEFNGWKIINYYGWGGFLLWWLPVNPYFIDGRQLPGEATFRSHQAMFYDLADHEETSMEIIQKYQVGLVMYPAKLNKNVPLEKLFPGAMWALIYFDNLCQIYLPRLPKHQEEIARFEYKIVDPTDSEMRFFEKAQNDKSYAKMMLKELKRAVKDDPQSYALLPLAKYYFQQKDWANAARYLEMMAKANPRIANTWIRLGQAYKMMGQTEKAKSCFIQAKKLDPTL